MFENEITRFHEAVSRAQRIMITATEREDGDSIAAELGVRYLIQTAFPNTDKTIDIINVKTCPPRYRFLEGSDAILPLDRISDRHYDLGVVVDCGIDRSGPVKDIFQMCPTRVKIDHHSFGNEGEYDIEIVTNQVASTTEILFHFVDHPIWPGTLDPLLAELIYIGIICDTGSFQYDLTKSSTHQVAARLLETGFDFPKTAERVHLARSFEMKRLLGLVLEKMQRAPHGRYLWSIMTREMVQRASASHDDMGDIIDEICFVNGVEVSMLFVEQGTDQIRISFRSKGGINVGKFARTITPTGGGHPRASGCVLPGQIEEVVAFVCRQMDEEMRSQGLIPRGE